MDAFKLLKNDHKIVSGLFDQIESASGNAKSQLFARLKNELDAHAEVEERIFYPALENKEESREITLEAYEEHKVVKDLLAQLANGRTADDQWDAQLKVLRENVEHHVEEEEGELFDKASDVLNDETIERLGSEMEAAKARLQGLNPPSGAAKRASKGKAKSAGSRKQAQSPGVLKRLANLVGLGASAEGSKGSTKAAAKAGARKSAGKASSKKAGTKKAGKASKAGASKKAGSSKASAKRSAPKKAAKRSGGSKQRKSTGSKKR